MNAAWKAGWGGPPYTQLQEQWRQRADTDPAWKANLAWNDWNPDYVRYQEQIRRQAWRSSVSQNWLNAMLDVELGV